MIDDLPWYAWHVRRFPCKDIAIGVLEVGELALLFGRELGPDPHRLGRLGGVNPHRPGFLRRVEGTRGGRLIAVWDY